MYALSILTYETQLIIFQRPSEVRQQFEQSHMPVEEAPDDDDVRQSYNFAPGYHGLVYRADGPDAGGHQDGKDATEGEDEDQKHKAATGDTHYKLQSMQWGKSPLLHKHH